MLDEKDCNTGAINHRLGCDLWYNRRSAPHLIKEVDFLDVKWGARGKHLTL